MKYFIFSRTSDKFFLNCNLKFTTTIFTYCQHVFRKFPNLYDFYKSLFLKQILFDMSKLANSNQNNYFHKNVEIVFKNMRKGF